MKLTEHDKRELDNLLRWRERAEKFFALTEEEQEQVLKDYWRKRKEEAHEICCNIDNRFNNIRRNNPKFWIQCFASIRNLLVFQPSFSFKVVLAFVSVL